MDQITLDYQSLRNVLEAAYKQASEGKGKDRHAQDLPFQEQPMHTISNLLGTHDGLLYQAIKKCQESKRMEFDPAIAELLGAINYIAGAVIQLQQRQAKEEAAPAVTLRKKAFAEAILANFEKVEARRKEQLEASKAEDRKRVEALVAQGVAIPVEGFGYVQLYRVEGTAGDE